MQSSAPVVVFGGIVVDRLAATTEPLVMGASNPGSAERRIGGVGLNVATVLARIGVPVRLVTRVGDDEDGRLLVKTAKNAGIDCRDVGVSLSLPTGTYTAIFDHHGDLVAGVAHMDVFDEMKPGPGGNLPAAASSNEIQIVDANLPIPAIEYLCDRAAREGRLLAAMTVSPKKARKLIGVLDRIPLLFTNRAEAASLLAHDPDEAPATIDMAGDLHALGCHGVVVTDRSNPVAMASGGMVLTRIPPPVSVTRVNGAGDSLVAGTIAGMAAGQPLDTAIDNGLAAAALVLENGGIAEAMFSHDRLQTMTDYIRGEAA